MKKKQPNEQRITVLYARLSRDDEKEGISGSIQNQLTKRVHETGHFYDADLEGLRQSHDKLWDAAREVLTSLAKLR